MRGVAVDQILRNLMELQLVRIVGRSDLPGRPMLYGTTQKFLEHFGINALNDLPGVDELRRIEGYAAGKKEDDEPEAGDEAAEEGDGSAATEAAAEGDGEP